MDDNNIDNTTDTWNSSLNEFLKEEDGFINPFSHLMINSPYYDLNGLINNLIIKQSTDIFHAKILYLNIQSLASKFDSLTTLPDTMQTIYSDYIFICEMFLLNEHLPGYNLISTFFWVD